MKFQSLLLLGFTVVTFASTTVPSETLTESELEEDYASCYAADGLCTKLAAAIAAGKGQVGAPTSGNSNEHAKRAEDFLLTAINDAETGQVSKRSAVADPRWRLCIFRGSICLKTKRAAEAIEDILAEPLEKVKRSAVADPAWRLCIFRGSICLKAKRSAEQLLKAARDVNGALTSEWSSGRREKPFCS